MSTTIIIIIITCITSYLAFQDSSRKYKWMMNPYQIVHRKQYGRLITSGFIHADWVHLIFNMLTLYFFGDIVEFYFNQVSQYGTVLYIAMYVLGILVSDIPSLIKHKDNPNYNALGASGAVSAVVFSSILFNPLQELCLYGLLCLPGFIFGAIYVIYSYFSAKNQRDNIGHEAHLAGAAFGIIFTILLWPQVISHFLNQMANFSLF